MVLKNGANMTPPLNFFNTNVCTNIFINYLKPESQHSCGDCNVCNYNAHGTYRIKNRGRGDGPRNFQGS